MCKNIIFVKLYPEIETLKPRFKYGKKRVLITLLIHFSILINSFHRLMMKKILWYSLIHEQIRPNNGIYYITLKTQSHETLKRKCQT